ncbi:hypothetical protein ACMFWY_06195 [Roseiconus sp. JC912]|uniref:hypothetical protein n=1 Tax=Roseiconus sp. JC912 TaxID=3396307 RepID=UPI003A4C8178
MSMLKTLPFKPASKSTFVASLTAIAQAFSFLLPFAQPTAYGAALSVKLDVDES